MNGIHDILERRVSKAFRAAEEELLKPVAAWSASFPQHIVYIEERRLGLLFFEVYRGSRALRIWSDAEEEERYSLTLILAPLRQVYRDLCYISDRYRYSIDFHCYCRGKPMTHAEFRSATNGGIR